MISYKQILTDIAAAIVDEPESVSVSEKEGEDNDGIVLVLSVAPDDMGKVIGKHGRIAKAIRSVIRAAAVKNGDKVTVEIK